MNSLFKKSIGLFLLAVTLFSTSCRKDDFDNPPAGGTDPNLIVNKSIADLKAGYVNGQFQTITSDWIISGIVTADDRSGNFYKTMIIQDSTAAIAVRIDESDFYTKYPIGRRVFIKLKGLVLGDYNKLIQIGGFIDNSNPTFPSVQPIPYALVTEHLFPGQYNLVINPEVVTISQVNANTLYYQNRFIRLQGVEFDPADTSLTYADVTNQLSANRTINDCSGGSIDIRSSNYATFAGDTIPNLRGTITGIYSVYGTTPQMYIRDIYDVVMDTLRCNGSGGGGGGGTAVSTTIGAIRSLYTGTDVTIGSLKIKGVVISDKSTNNFNSQNITIQDSTGGIVVRFGATHPFVLNAEVEIDLSGQILTSYTGFLEVNGVPLVNATQTGTGTISPRVATVSDVIANFSSWESTLVKVNNSTITSTNGNYGASAAPYPTVNLNDGTGTILLYTKSSANFTGTAVPTGAVSVTAIVVPYNTTKELMIRNTSDVQ
ncbi:MAG: DUF5689 domain-containing protein [Arcticibacter sp.]